MVGYGDDGAFKLKGAETWGFLLFILDDLECACWSAVPDKERLLIGGRCLEKIVLVWKQAAWRMTPNEIAECFNNFNRFASITAGSQYAEQLEPPKRHLSIHMLGAMERFGNPRYFACWVNEADNKMLKKATKYVHASTFEATVLSGRRALQVKLARDKAVR